MEEEDYLKLVKLEYAIDGDLSKKQIDKLIKIFRKYTKKDKVHVLLDCLAYYSDNEELNDGLLIRVERALRNWNPQTEKTVYEWLESINILLDYRHNSEEHHKNIISRLNLNSDEENEYWLLYETHSSSVVYEAANKAIREQKGLWFVKEQLNDWEKSRND